MVKLDDVELEKALTLDDSPVDPAAGASADKGVKDNPPEGGVIDKEEYSPRAKERIDTLLRENADLAAKVATKPADMDVETFLNAIEDEPSRNLLRSFYGIVERQVTQRFAPVMSEYQGSKFEKEFAAYEQKFPELAQHKADIRKTFERDPSQPLKGLVGERLLDLQTSKVVPVESTKSTVDTAPKGNLDEASKEDLYDLLESNRK